MTNPSPLADALALLREEIRKSEDHLGHLEALGLGRPPEAPASIATPSPLERTRTR